MIAKLGVLKDLLVSLEVHFRVLWYPRALRFNLGSHEVPPRPLRGPPRVPFREP